MSSILEQVINFFQQEEWEFNHVVSQNVLRLEIEGSNGEWICYARVKEAEQQFVFYSDLPGGVPAEKRMAVAEYITRANNGIILGNFEMDFEDGEVHFKTSIEANPEILNSDLIRPVVYANISIMDHYLPGFRMVIDQDIPPEQAIQELDVN